MDAKELKPGESLGRYQLLLPIAKGGMGQVWAAQQSGTRGFQKLVAVKTILAVAEDSADLEEMLFEEASLASVVRHPNVAQTLDLGEQDGTLYLVMEWVDGEPLDVVLRTARGVGGIPVAIAVHFIIQACKGLHAAHEAKDSKGEPLGIVHRDVSPQNLLVTYSGVVKLVDFGVAKATHQSSQPTAIGQIKGKFAYMSPEQVNGQPVDARSDIFAMGIVLYRITTGKHPFKAETPAATVHNILSTGPPPPSTVVPNYPAALEQVVMKALARERAERFASAHEMMLALEHALPATVIAHAERNAETFLRRLFDERISERHNALQGALKAALAGSAETLSGVGQPSLRSQSTMRAVSVESSSDVSAGGSRGQAVAISLLPIQTRWRWSAFALVAGLVLAVGAVALRNRSISEANGGAFGALRPAGVETPAPAAGFVPLTPLPSAVSEAAASAGPLPASAASSLEARPSNDASSAARAAASSSSSPRKLGWHARREVGATAPEPAATAVPASPDRSAGGDGDPLNRRK